jgi:hypothetical protein
MAQQYTRNRDNWSVSDAVTTLRRILPFTWVLCAIAAIYTGSVMFSRWQAARDDEKAVQRARAEQDRRILSRIGDGVKILSFYASPPVIHPGEKTLLCYGTGNAKKVILSPPVDSVWPSNARCIQLAPRETTSYTITATDENGKSASQTTEIQVVR